MTAPTTEERKERELELTSYGADLRLSLIHI